MALEPEKKPLQIPPLPVMEPSWGTFQVWWQQVKLELEANARATQMALDQINKILTGTGIDTGTGDPGEEPPWGGLTRQAAILGSFTIPTLVLSSVVGPGPKAQINIIDHVRRYGDTVQQGCGPRSITDLDFSTVYAVFYDDSKRNQAIPNYRATKYPQEAQHNYVAGRHYVGTIKTCDAAGASGTTGGGPPAGSGYTAGAGSIVILE